MKYRKSESRAVSFSMDSSLSCQCSTSKFCSMRSGVTDFGIETRFGSAKQSIASATSDKAQCRECRETQRTLLEAEADEDLAGGLAHRRRDLIHHLRQTPSAHQASADLTSQRRRGQAGGDRAGCLRRVVPWASG